MESAIVVLLWFSLQLSIAGSGMENGDPCEDDGRVVHLDKGRFRCCVHIKCIPGTEVLLCDATRSTSCVNCKPDMFQPYTTESFNMRKCRPHTRCSDDAVVSHPGSSTTDVTCTCNLKLGFYGSWPDCFSDVRCSPGSQLMLSGDCEQCSDDSYQNVTSSGPCLPCSRCDLEMQEVDKACTSVSDTVCRNETLGRNPEKVDSLSMTQLLLAIIFGGFLLSVIIVSTVVLGVRKCRNKDQLLSRSTSSNGSTSHSDPSIVRDSMTDQYYGDITKEDVKENLYHQCPRGTGEAEKQVTEILLDFDLRRSSLCDRPCECEAIQCRLNSDLEHHTRSESVGLLDSPPADTSVMDTSLNLIDERVNARDGEDDQQSVQFEVETEGSSANETTDALPSCSHGAVVMKGKCNLNRGNVFHFENCRNIKFVQPK